MAVAGVVFAAISVVFAVSQWRQVADLRAHGVEATATVVSVSHGAKGSTSALLEIPRPDGTSVGAEIDVWPLTKVHEGNQIEVTYDPDRLDMVQRGWGIDYATPIVLSLVAIGLGVGAVALVRAAFTGRPVSVSRRRRPARQPLRPGQRRKPIKRPKARQRR